MVLCFGLLGGGSIINNRSTGRRGHTHTQKPTSSWIRRSHSSAALPPAAPSPLLLPPPLPLLLLLIIRTRPPLRSAVVGPTGGKGGRKAKAATAVVVVAVSSKSQGSSDGGRPGRRIGRRALGLCVRGDGFMCGLIAMAGSWISIIRIESIDAIERTSPAASNAAMEFGLCVRQPALSLRPPIPSRSNSAPLLLLLLLLLLRWPPHIDRDA